MDEHFLLFDVGGTDIKVALADVAGNLSHVRREPTRRANGVAAAEVLISQIKEMATRIREASGINPIAAGLVVCGLVDAERGVGIYSANLGWREAPLRDMAEDVLGIPVGFGHDVTLAARAELVHGSGASEPKLRQNAVVLVIGTGIASALLVEGQLVASGGYAGELGHALVPGGLSCECGLTGCLETLGSAGAIAKRYERRTGHQGGAREVFEARRNGDSVAAEIIGDAVEALSFTLAQLCASLAPEGIVIGGGLAQAGPPLFQELETALNSKLSFHRRPQLFPALLGAEAGLQGALILAREMTSEGSAATR